MPDDLAAALDPAGKTAFEALTSFRQAEITQQLDRAGRADEGYWGSVDIPVLRYSSVLDVQVSRR